jgi:hypothetical protein
MCLNAVQRHAATQERGLEETWRMRRTGEKLDGVTEEYFINTMTRDVQFGLQNGAAKLSSYFGKESWVVKEIRHKKKRQLHKS